MGNAIEKPQGAFDKLDNHAFGRKHPELWKLVKWAIVGFIANVPELAVHMLCCKLFTLRSVTYLPNLGVFQWLAERQPKDTGYHIAVLVYAYLISTAVGYTIAFILNRKATFHADSNVALSTFLYVLFVIFTIFANGIIGPAITVLVGKLVSSKDIVQIISKFLSMMVPGIWFYPANRFIIHRKKKAVK